MPIMHTSCPTNLSAAIRASFENASRLCEDGQYLLEYGCSPSAYALSILAQEEYAKAFLLILVQGKSIPWNPDVCVALRNHTCKQLVGTIMEYLENEWEDYLATLKLRGTPLFPPHIADAINIIRHEKVPRENATVWLWDEASPCDKKARRISDGKIDKQKQNALYVDVGKTGQVSSTPLSISKEHASAELEKAKRLRAVFSREDGNITALETVEYLHVSDTFRLLFGFTTVDEYNKRW
jgi:AbiV family abortive infection protein